MLTVRTTLEPFGPATAIILSDDQVAQLGSAKTPPVWVSVNGATARLRVARMGGENCIGLSKAARAELGVEIGETITAVIELDTAERTVELPSALAEALSAQPTLKAAFDALAYSQRKEHSRAVADAKKPETRDRRIAKIIDALREAR